MTHSDPRQDTLPRRAERLVLDRFAPASILVNRDGDVLWTCGPTARYLEAADGRANVNVLAQARASLRVWLASALREVQAAGSRGVELRGLRLVEAGPEVVVDVRVLPLDDAADAPGTSLVVISEPSPAGPGGSHADAAPGATPATPADPAARLPALRQTVRRLREQLQAATESHQAAHEELQSSNEELITSREEMQSMNEELQAINAELQAKLDALALAQSDMKNLLDSTQIATLFLDSALNLRRFTAQARTVINLRDGDAGRPLSDLTTRLDDPGLVDRAAQVLRTLVPSEQEVSGTGGGWYSVRILPYRTVDDVVDGVVITITDIARPDASQRPRPTGPDR